MVYRLRRLVNLSCDAWFRDFSKVASERFRETGHRGHGRDAHFSRGPTHRTFSPESRPAVRLHVERIQDLVWQGVHAWRGSLLFPNKSGMVYSLFPVEFLKSCASVYSARDTRKHLHYIYAYIWPEMLDPRIASLARLIWKRRFPTGSRNCRLYHRPKTDFEMRSQLSTWSEVSQTLRRGRTHIRGTRLP